MNRRIGIVILATVTLCGCGIFGGPADRALRRSPNYRAGYADGCSAAAGGSANPREQPQALTNEDRAYRRGYAGGLAACRPTGVAPGDAPYRSPTGGIQVPG